MRSESGRYRALALLWDLANRLGIGGTPEFIAQEVAYRLGAEPPYLDEEGYPTESWVQMVYDLYVRVNND